jgi:hypothetical protein
MSVLVKKKSILVYLIIITGIITGCNSYLNNGKKLNLKVSLVKINAWENLMPGKESSFHVSGTVNIKNNEEINLSSIHLREIVISQGKELVSQSHVLFNSSSGENSIHPNSEVSFNFKTSMVLDMIDRININNPISVELLFTSSAKNYNFKIDNIKIEKVY